MADPVKEVKIGLKSSEFWLTIAGNVVGIIAAVAGVVDPKTAGVLMAIVNGFYAISRGVAKK